MCQVRRADGKNEVEDQVRGRKFEVKGMAVNQLFRCKWRADSEIAG